MRNWTFLFSARTKCGTNGTRSTLLSQRASPKPPKLETICSITCPGSSRYESQSLWSRVRLRRGVVSLGTSLRTCFLHNNVVRFYWGSYESTSPIPVSFTLCFRKSLTWRKTSRCWRKPSRIKPTRCRFDQIVSYTQVFLFVLFCHVSFSYLSICVLSAGVSNAIGDTTEAT